VPILLGKVDLPNSTLLSLRLANKGTKQAVDNFLSSCEKSHSLLRPWTFSTHRPNWEESVEKFKTDYSPFIMNGFFVSNFMGITTPPDGPFAEMSASLLQPLGPSLSSLLIIFSGSTLSDVAPTYTELVSLLNQVTNVNHLGLKFYRWSPINEEEVEAIRISLPSRPSLKELEISILSEEEHPSSSNTVIELMLQKYGPQLKKFTFSNDFGVSFNLNNVNLSNLECLELNCFHKQSLERDVQAFTQLSRRNLGNLKVLVLSGVRIHLSYQLLNLLRNLSTLEELHLAQIIWLLFVDPRPQDRGVLPNLRKLVTDNDNFKSVQRTLFRVIFSKLEEIKFEPGQNVHVSSLEPNMPSIERLFLLYPMLKRVVWKRGLRVRKEIVVRRPKVQGI